MTLRMAKFMLVLEDDYPYFIVGINASAPNYRLCWHLNKLFGISLKMENPIDIHSKKGLVTAHNVFSYLDENINVKYRLIENKKGSSLFLPEVTKADYLFVIDENDRIPIREVITEINTISLVVLAFEIEIDLLKQKQNLMLTA